MSQALVPLPKNDYAVMNCGHDDFENKVMELPLPTHARVINAVNRLALVSWLANILEETIIRCGPPIVQEDLLANQMHLLLTCADLLGHEHVPKTEKRVEKRFRAFFDHLPHDVQQRLVNVFLVLKTPVQFSTESNWRHSVVSRSSKDRFDDVVGFLFDERCMFTHDADFPRLGHIPILKILQNVRLGVPNVSNSGDVGRLRVATEYAAFIDVSVSDPIAELRYVILRGLAQFV